MVELQAFVAVDGDAMLRHQRPAERLVRQFASMVLAEQLAAVVAHDVDPEGALLWQAAVATFPALRVRPRHVSGSTTPNSSSMKSRSSGRSGSAGSVDS
jgi:hypothetical protein